MMYNNRLYFFGQRGQLFYIIFIDPPFTTVYEMGRRMMFIVVQASEQTYTNLAVQLITHLGYVAACRSWVTNPDDTALY